MIKLITYKDFIVFQKEVIPFLKQNEAEHSLLLGIISSLSEKDKKPLVMATVVRDGRTTAVFFQNNPLQIIVAKEGAFIPREIHEIAAQLHTSFLDIPGLIGEKKFTMRLAEYLADIRVVKAKVHMNQRLYKLEKIKKPARKTGTLRKVNESDIDQITDWIYQFCIEINQPLTLKEAKEKANATVKNGNLVVWEVDGEFVSMANAGRPTESNITINFVYTPISQRNKGYASDCVSELTKSMLEQGYKSTTLYTDLGNPISNKIYKEIGYQPIMDSIVIFFNEKLA